MGYLRRVPGFAVAILKVAAWLNLLFGVGVSFAFSLFGAAIASKLPGGDFTRIAVQLFSAFEGFAGWALLLVVANLAEQLDRVHEKLMRADEPESSDD
jgi:hypothetical protein